MKQGEIYLVDLDPVVGLEVGGTQLVVVVSSDIVNASFLPAMVVPARDASTAPPSRVTGVHILASESGLPIDVVVSCINTRSLDRSRFPASTVGTVPHARLKDIEKALHFVFRV